MSSRRILLAVAFLLGGGLALWQLSLQEQSHSARSRSTADTLAPSRPRRASASRRLVLPKRAAPTDAGAAQSQPLISATWGAGPGQAGRTLAKESNPEGPMRIVSDGRGGLLLLDQVNGRLLRYDAQGKLLASFPIGSSSAQDVAVDANGNILVLDRLGRPPQVRRFDDRGGELGKVPLTGEQLTQPGRISALLSDSSGIYVELAHEDVLRVADAAGNSVSPDKLPGRPSRDGKLYLKAGLMDRTSGRVFVQAHDAQGKLLWEAVLRLGAQLLHILMLDSDAAGNVYLGAEVTDQPEGERTLVARLEGGKGQLTGQLTLPATTKEASESFRPLTVAPDGTIYQLLHTAQGATVTPYRFP